jgi:hypothetical protein
MGTATSESAATKTLLSRRSHGARLAMRDAWIEWLKRWRAEHGQNSASPKVTRTPATLRLRRRSARTEQSRDCSPRGREAAQPAGANEIAQVPVVKI